MTRLVNFYLDAYGTARVAGPEPWASVPFKLIPNLPNRPKSPLEDANVSD